MIIFSVNAANYTCCLGWDSCGQTCETLFDNTLKLCLITHYLTTEKVAYGCDGILGLPEYCGNFERSKFPQYYSGCTSFKTGDFCCCYGDR